MRSSRSPWCSAYKYTWQQALAFVFISGVLALVITATRLRETIINLDPAEPEAGGVGRRRPVPRHHRARAIRHRRRASGDAGNARLSWGGAQRPEETTAAAKDAAASGGRRRYHGASRPPDDRTLFDVVFADDGADGDAPLRLRLRLSNASWISAYADGQRVVYRLAQPGEDLRIEASRAITLHVGDAGAVAYALNGEMAQPLGDTGKVLTVRITGAGLRPGGDRGAPRRQRACPPSG